MAKSKFDGVDISATEARIESGIVFELSEKITIANGGGVGKWLFRTGNKRVIIMQRQVTSNADGLDYQVFKEPDVTGDGTPALIVNMNSKDGLKRTVEAYSDPATTGGTPIPSIYMPGAEGVGGRTVGQFNREGNIRVLDAKTTYLAQVTNSGSVASATVELYLMWAEVTDPNPNG